MDADVIVIGAGLAGLVATAELADAGKRVILLDQEGEQNIGGQAFWSFGGLFFVDSPEQRRMGIRDSLDLARQDWEGSAGFDRPEDEWGRRWAEAYLHFAHGEKRAWLHAQGMRWFPLVGWAERGGGLATGHGNSVPRFHVTWGTGPAVIAPFERRVREAQARGLVDLRFRHKVDALTTSGGVPDGVAGEILAPTNGRARRRVRERPSGPSRSGRRRSSSPRAASAAISTSSARTGRRGSAPCRIFWCPACPPMSTGACR
jgi:predicted oxidoreductase